MNNKALIEKYYTAFNQRNWDEFFSLMAENIVHDINHGQRESGKAAFRAFMKVMDHHYSEQVVNLVVFTSDNSNRAAAEFYIDGKYIKSQNGLPEAKGQTYHIPVGAFFEIQNGLITRVTNYYNLTQWIEQVSK